jgi:hypothetical protein
MNGIFINTRKSQCSIYSSGLLINESLQSNEWNLDYIEIDKLSLDDLHNGRIVADGFSELYDFYIFNYHTKQTAPNLSVIYKNSNHSINKIKLEYFYKNLWQNKIFHVFMEKFNNKK